MCGRGAKGQGKRAEMCSRAGGDVGRKNGVMKRRWGSVGRGEKLGSVGNGEWGVWVMHGETLGEWRRWESREYG